ncbi:hypothetical protein [Nocardia gamkensis]|uniref:hypothetical protein n=1 Tax=Nocardia gamkensis TaxID=352869 RepID=UPI0037C6BBE0
MRVGAPRRDIPTCYGSWRAIYALFPALGSHSTEGCTPRASPLDGVMEDPDRAAW